MAAKRIAVVDHDPVYMRLMEHILKVEGFQPIMLSGTEAHDVISRDLPDLVMIDTWLSRRDEGMALLQTLKLDEATKTIPLLIASSDPDDLSERLMELGGCIEVLRKPFTEDLLLAAIHRLLAQSAQE